MSYLILYIISTHWRSCLSVSNPRCGLIRLFRNSGLKFLFCISVARTSVISSQKCCRGTEITEWIQDWWVRSFLVTVTPLPGHSCSKLMTLLVNVSLKISNVSISNTPMILLKKMCEKLLSSFQQKLSVYLVIKS